jgi:predicted phosphodiesterase
MGRNIATDLILSYCQKWKSVPNMTLAKKIYKENSKLFKDVEQIRSVIRSLRGVHGDKHRKVYKTKAEYTPVYSLPESFAETFEPHKVNFSRVLIISDLHFPYQDNKAIETAINYGVEKDVNCILINGDLFDFASISRHEKDWRQRTVKDEFDAVRQFLDYLKHKLPKAKIVFKEGNHDERMEKWLFHKAPEYFDMHEFRLDVLLNFGERGIEYVKDKRPVKVGKLTVLHGHELNGSGGVNPARATFLKTIDNVLIGHCHRSSQHTEPTLSGSVIVTTSIGCLCGMYPMFARVNKWNHGFGYVEHDVKSGDYHLHNLKIINGKVF